MNFDFIPSLEYMAHFKMALTLWNKHWILYDVFRSNLPHLWDSLDNEIKEVIGNLPLTIIMRERLMLCYKITSFEIAVWIKFVSDYVPMRYIYICIRDVVWTTVHTIDKKMTAELLVRNEKLPITVRYELACIHCIESHIKLLYDMLPPDNNYEHFVSDDIKNELFSNDNLYEHNKLIVAWTHELRQGQMDYVYLYQYAVMHGNKVAADILFDGINLELTLYVINAIVHSDFWQKVHFLEVLTLLLEEMDMNELTELLHSKNIHVLRTVLFCIKHWPWNYCFSETNSCTCGVFRDPLNYLTAFNVFYKPRKEEYNPKMYRGCLSFFRKEFPTMFPSLIRHCDHENILVHIFKANDINSLELALKYLPEIKKNIFFRKWCNILCKYMIDQKDFSMLEVIYREFAGLKWIIMEYETNIANLIEKLH